MSEQHDAASDRAEPLSVLDESAVERLIGSLALLSSELLGAARDLQERTAGLRASVFEAANVMLKDLSPADRGIVWSAAVVGLQRRFDQMGSPKAEFSQGCLGRQGGGVTVKDGNVSATACVMIDSPTEPPSGGGVEVTFSY